MLQLRAILLATSKVALDSNKGKSASGAFKPTEDTKVILVDPEDADKMVRVSTSLTTK
jgi:hypothetical protein